MKARFHPTSASIVAFFAAFLLGQSNCFAASNLRITRALCSQTVPLGAPVKLDVKFEASSLATIQWYHDSILIRNATNDTYSLASVTAEDIGTYSVVIRAASQQVTNSAVIDIAVPYPDVKVEESVVLDFSGPIMGQVILPGQKAILPSGKIVQAPCGYFWPVAAEQWFECWSPPNSLLWRSTTDMAEYQRLVGNIDWSPNGNIRIGASALKRFSVFGTNVDYSVTWVQLEVTESGRLVYFRTNSAFQGTDFMSNPDGTITVNSQNGEILAFSYDGALLNRVKAVPNAAMYGRAFYILGSINANTRFPEFNFLSASPTATIYGKYSSNLEPAWMTEVELGGRMNTLWTGWPPDVLRATVDTPDDGILTILAADDQKSTNSVVQSIVKIIHGRIAWEVPFTSSPAQTGLSSFAMMPMGTILCWGWLMAPESTISIGDRKIGPFGMPFTYAALIDQGGFVRNVMTNAPGVDFGKQPLRTGPSRFYAFGYDTNIQRTLRVKVYIPEPDLSEPPAPERIMSVQNGETVTLSASPNVPGVCVYRWFKDGREISGARDHDLQLSSFGVGDAGQYTVKIRNAYGAVTNRIATLTYVGPEQMAAELRDSTVTISWPLSFGGYHLQQAQALDEDFTDIPFVLSVTNGPAATVEFTVPLDSTQRFFRFMKAE